MYLLVQWLVRRKERWLELLIKHTYKRFCFFFLRTNHRKLTDTNRFQIEKNIVRSIPEVGAEVGLSVGVDVGSIHKNTCVN